MKRNNSSHHGYKTLMHAFEAAQTSSLEAKKYLQDKRLTSQEKKLVTSLVLLRGNDFSFLENLVNDQSFESVVFLKALKHLVLGWAFVYKANSSLAIEHLGQSLRYLKECGDERFVQRMIFRCHINMFYAYTNQKKLAEMKFHFDEVSATERIPEDEATFQIMRVCFFSMSGQYALAEEALDEVRALKSSLTDVEVMSYFIESFDLCLKLDMFEKAESTLVEMKNHRTFRLSACFKYMDKLLKYLMKGER